MTDVPQVSLPDELKEVQQRWLQLSRKEQDELYAKEFVPRFAPLFAELPLYGAPPSLPRPEALVSILGFSWQPVALMAAWCRPKRMLVLGTEESLGGRVAGENVLAVIARVAGIGQHVIEAVRIGDPGEADIYRAVRNFLGSGDSHRKVFVDPTGGKKSMSASAALAAFLAGAPLVYVDYKHYHGPNRIPIAGTEYPRLLTNPLQVLGDLEMRDVFAAFRRSDFAEAERLAKRLAMRLYEPREAEALAALAACYAAWDRFDFAAARGKLEEARDLIARFADQGDWRWAANVTGTLERNARALQSLAGLAEKPASIEDGLPLIAWYLAAAERLLSAGKPSLAVLLLYAAIERYVGVCLWVEHGLDGDEPDYRKVQSKIDWEQYDAAGRKLFGNNYRRRELEGKLMFANSAQLLAALSPQRLELGDLSRLKNLAATRNKCEYEHGFLPKQPSEEGVAVFLSNAKEIVARCCGPEKLEALLADCRFAALEPGSVRGEEGQL